MTTYRLINNIFEFHAAYVDFKAMRRQFNNIKVWFDQENEPLLDKLKDQWNPVAVKFESDRKANSTPDISVWNSSCLVLSSKAYKHLKTTLESGGEFLPLEDGFYLYNCLDSVAGDTVDPNKTIMDLESPESAHTFKSLSFIAEKIKDKPIFKPGFAYNGFLLCQDEFKEIAENNELGGVIFEEDLAQIFPKKK